MYSILSVALIGVLIGATIGWRCDRDGVSLLMGGVFGGVIGAICGVLVGIFISDYVPRHSVATGPSTLVAMRSADGVSGSFVWGSGSIKSEVNYNFLIRNTDGSLTPGQVSANSTVHLIEDASLKDVGYWTTTWDEADQSSPWANWSIGESDDDKITRQEFRVPVGTVVQSLSIR